MNTALASRTASPSFYSVLLLALIVLAFAMQASFVAAVLGGAPSVLASASAQEEVHPVACVPCDG